MRYDHTVEQSGELLRMVLPMLAKHPAAYHPISYALWYEHVARMNPDLSRDIEALLREGEAISDQRAVELYQAHILDAWSRRTLTLNSRIERLLDTFHTNAAHFTDGAGAFDEDWQALREALIAVPDSIHDNLRTRILSSGDQMNGTLDRLRAEIDAGAEESRRLRLELSALKAQAITDPLTGLLNRRGLEGAWDDLCEREGGLKTPCTAILLDVDHFKRFNDMFGHVLGDQVLKSVAASIQQRTREQDHVARYGGEEFLLLLPGTSLPQGASVAESIRRVVEQTELTCNVKTGRTANVTVSLGVTARRPEDTLTSLIARADEAMYQAKRRGRNAVVPVA